MKTYVLATFCALALTFAVPTTSQARLGETKAECEKRYGEAVETGGVFMGADTNSIYHKNGFLIVVGYIDGICTFVAFTKPGEYTNQEMSEHEIKTLMEANSNGQRWTQTARGNWSLPDGSVAVFTYGSNQLSFATQGFVSKMNERTKAKESKNLEDF
ncbi:MAG: hypothetical protein AAGK14_06395 [Verrucomicrobiota bacterium]